MRYETAFRFYRLGLRLAVLGVAIAFLCLSVLLDPYGRELGASFLLSLSPYALAVCVFGGGTAFYMARRELNLQRGFQLLLMLPVLVDSMAGLFLRLMEDYAIGIAWHYPLASKAALGFGIVLSLILWLLLEDAS